MLWGSSLLLYNMHLARYLITLLVSSLVLTINAQESTPHVRQLYTQRMQADIEKVDAVLEARSAIERVVEDSKRTKLPKKMTIPIVFHILYVPGQAYPQEQQIAAQINALNRDFASAEFTARQVSSGLNMELEGVDTEISFCVPAKNPLGKKTTGIDFIPTTVEAWGLTEEMKSSDKGGSDPWDPNMYMNVWVVTLIDSISGWAQMPGGPLYSDGIVIDRRFFGSGGTALAPYDEGKTLTHLVGNYLNLYDLWSDKTPCSDDYVGDTPIHDGPNYACYDHERHLSMCNDNPLEMTMNFMDNTEDNCMYMFTAGQKQRMQATLLEDGPRAALIEQEMKCGRLPTSSSTALTTEVAQDAKSEPVIEVTEEAEPRIVIFPNPTTDRVSVSISTAITTAVRVVAYDVLGSLVYESEQTVDGGNIAVSIDVSQWATGAYMVHVKTSAHSYSERLIVK